MRAGGFDFDLGARDDVLVDAVRPKCAGREEGIAGGCAGGCSEECGNGVRGSGVQGGVDASGAERRHAAAGAAAGVGALGAGRSIAVFSGLQVTPVPPTSF